MAYIIPPVKELLNEVLPDKVIRAFGSRKVAGADKRKPLPDTISVICGQRFIVRFGRHHINCIRVDFQAQRVYAKMENRDIIFTKDNADRFKVYEEVL